ncbi:DUF4230 domain-containing protein [Pleurocapsales cyanobacterium LEGE 10410]|nr:DUF4230 domain-containing protein [Pleurocapsales cyanobacterium LEGE 10410]
MKTLKSSLPFWQQLLLWGIGGINLIFLLVFLSIWRTGDRALNFVSNLFKPQIESQVESSTLIVQRIQSIQQLATTVQTIETVVPASAERKLGEIPLATTRLLYIARGEIKAGIDLSELTDKDIKISQNTIEINLPPAKILDSKIDVNHSRVYDYDRGFLNLGPDVAPQLQTLAQRTTLTKIINTACNDGILNAANAKAEQAISEFLAITSDRSVKIYTTMPDSCKASVNKSYST